jgi:hypothetical protein
MAEWDGIHRSAHPQRARYGAVLGSFRHRAASAPLRPVADVTAAWTKQLRRVVGAALKRQRPSARGATP